jgi:hypothetical protein
MPAPWGVSRILRLVHVRIAYDVPGVGVRSCRCRVSAAGRGREETGQTRQAGAEHPVRHRCGGCGRTGVVPQHARPSFIVHCMHATTRSSPHAQCGQAGMRAHADGDASCEVLYGGADADAGAEAGSLALRLVRVCA